MTSRILYFDSQRGVSSKLVCKIHCGTVAPVVNAPVAPVFNSASSLCSDGSSTHRGIVARRSDYVIRWGRWTLQTTRRLSGWWCRWWFESSTAHAHRESDCTARRVSARKLRRGFYTRRKHPHCDGEGEVREEGGGCGSVWLDIVYRVLLAPTHLKKAMRTGEVEILKEVRVGKGQRWNGEKMKRKSKDGKSVSVDHQRILR